MDESEIFSYFELISWWIWTDIHFFLIIFSIIIHLAIYTHYINFNNWSWKTHFCRAVYLGFWLYVFNHIIFLCKNVSASKLVIKYIHVCDMGRGIKEKATITTCIKWIAHRYLGYNCVFFLHFILCIFCRCMSCYI